MEKLRRKVLVARRRMALQRFLRCLPWCLFVTLAIAAILIGVDKYYPLGLLPWAWPALGFASGLLAAGAWVGFTGQSELGAAIEIDRRFGLHERISSAYSLADDERASPVGRALVEDALRAIDRIEVAERFRLSLDRMALLPIVPAAAAFLVAIFLNPVAEKAVATTETVARKIQVKKATEVAQQKAAERLKEAKEQNLKELEEPLAKLEQGLKQLSKGENDRREALVKMNDLAKDLEQRREALRGDERMKDQFDQLKNLARGPADKLADALKEGDLKQATKELAALKEQLQSGQLDADAKASLSKQLEQMQEKLSGLAEKHRKMEDELKTQIAEKRAAGKGKEADALEKQLQKLAKQGPKMDQLERMAQKLGQCAECNKKGDSQGASEAMAQLQAELSSMADELAEAQLLDAALDELADAKDSIAGRDGDGNEGMGRFENSFGKQARGQPGPGVGRGHIDSEGDNEDLPTGHYDTKVKQQVGRGAVSVTDRVDGPNVKGRVEQEIQSQFQAAQGSAADPLADTKLPRGYREHARTYFDTLREGEKPSTAPLEGAGQPPP